jgi:hypothetical protein
MTVNDICQLHYPTAGYLIEETFFQCEKYFSLNQFHKIALLWSLAHNHFSISSKKLMELSIILPAPYELIQVSTNDLPAMCNAKYNKFVSSELDG